MTSIISKLAHLHLHRNGSAGPGSPGNSKPDMAEDSDDSDSTATTSTSGSTSSTVPRASNLYHEAAGYEKALNHAGCFDSDANTLLSSRNSEAAFNHLVRKDLSDEEQAATSHDDMEGGVSEQPTPQLKHRQSCAERASETPIINRPTQVEDLFTDLGPTEVVKILTEEFGPLGIPEEEKLLLEVDGVILRDVLIIGVIHLTTHRLAFHASLPSELDTEHPLRILAEGAATYHRPGWYAKRRIWLELTSDTLCAYPSGKEVDRMRPLCTLLLSSISEASLDEDDPRILRLFRHVVPSNRHHYLEFDTVESANHWKQELQGAMFLYCHRKQQVFSNDTSTLQGIRICVPLHRIEEIRRDVNPDFQRLVAIVINDVDDNLPSNFPFSELQKFHIGPVMDVCMWNILEGVVLDAKIRAQKSHFHMESPVYVDFGLFGHHEGLSTNGPARQNQENAARNALGFKLDEKIWIVNARVYNSLAANGYFVTSETQVGFWSKNLTKKDTKYRLSGSHIVGVKPFTLSWLSVDGLEILMRDNQRLRLAFKTSAVRDEALQRVQSVVTAFRNHRSSKSSISSGTSIDVASVPGLGSSSSVITRSPPFSNGFNESAVNAANILAPLSRTLRAAAVAEGKMPQELRNKLPKAINLPRMALLSDQRLHFVCLTIGSRGDVQPYIALGVRLLKEGHRVTIVTHQEYRDWILNYGIEHRQAGGDPGLLMQLSVNNKIMSPEFFRESLTKFRPWFDELLLEAWEGCKEADVLVESPSAMAGIHIAETLKIPYFRAFSMPWTKTTAFPHPFVSPPVDSPAFNRASYVLFGNVMWAATSKQINRWRQNVLNLCATDMGHLSQENIHVVLITPQTVVPKPLDWPDTVSLSGYWLLNDSDPEWSPTQELIDWMADARAEGKPIVYIGFGSVTVPNPQRMFDRIARAVRKSGARAILSKGWAMRMENETQDRPSQRFSEGCYVVDKVPHEWLFASIDAALHHGGAGTTAASLRAGIPTLIKPWFGDQFFWASRVEQLGVGLKIPNTKSSSFAKALTRATTDIDMKEKAMEIGERLRAEDGTHNAIYTIYTYLHRASQNRKTLA
ncbi:sterol 3-beta-glucosyltransferase [Coprinopsis marcescibilis]|uniref:sterol 3beta-glucosyltransferase n=1 Tax=Coprinopsis marcescibilis TaxID=230819 RepID=A0A5C3L4N9_COPMA|nr:sterol 3-beta-glucosyltransferase [Coprinopsis marcescibilis]